MSAKPITPTPWAISPIRAEGEVLIVKTWDPAVIRGPYLMGDYRGGHIAFLGIGGNPEAQATAEANAAFIIQAVNSYQQREDALVQALFALQHNEADLTTAAIDSIRQALGMEA